MAWNKKAYITQKVRQFYRHKERAAMISENENVFKPKIRPDAVVIIKLRDQPQMQFSTYRTPFGGWTISPTLAGKKVQQVLLHSNL